MREPDVTAFFDAATSTISYVVADPAERRCAIVDSVRDYDPKSGRTSYDSANRIVEFVRRNDLGVDWILETHAHADHLSAAPYLKDKLGGTIGIGEHIREVQKTFANVFNIEGAVPADGHQFDHLFADGDEFAIGSIPVRVMHTPGHTPACVSYVVGDAVFVGDTLFMPDFGTARCDFPGGDARALFRSIHKILALPPQTRMFMCHDYQPGGREPRWETTVAEQREQNVHCNQSVGEEEFVRMRTERDSGLDMPTLILPSVQVNIRAGRMPKPEDNGVSYLKIPIDKL